MAKRAHEINNHAFVYIAGLEITSPFISTQSARVEGKPYLFLANFSGLKSDEVVNQIPESNVKVSFIGKSSSKIFYLPFMGEKKLVPSLVAV